MSVTAITGFTSTLAQLLGRRFELAPAGPGLTVTIEPVGMSDFKKLDGDRTRIALLLWRVSHNEHLRNRPPSTQPTGRAQPLAVDLHLLFTVWADKADKEQLLLAWLLRELNGLPVLAGAALGTPFDAADAVQLVPQEMSLDDLSKLWQVLVPPLRPSLAYVARHVRLDLDRQPDAPLVQASRLRVIDPPIGLEAPP